MQDSSCHFLSILDLSPEVLESYLDLAASLKDERQRGPNGPNATALAGRHIAMLFEKPSLRTLSSFTIAVRELGGNVIEPPADVVFGSRESLIDVVRSLDRWVTAAIVRTFAQQRLLQLSAAVSQMRVVNALSNEEHPCQALADCLTLREHWKTLPGKTLAFIGDGNNVATSLVQAALMLGVNVHVASPQGFDLPDNVQLAASRLARHGARLHLFKDPFAAVQTAEAVYTDAWTSMGQESETEKRRVLFAGFQVNAALMEKSRPGALFMHCLPAHRGSEVTDEVIDGPTSVVFDQTDNRLHTEKAVLLMLLSNNTAQQSKN